MKRLPLIAMVLGFALLVALVGVSGVGEVAAAVAAVGWGVALVVLARAVTIGAAGLGWSLLFPAGLRPSVSFALQIRFVREAVNTLLPFTQVGGDVIGARLLTYRGVNGALSSASVVVDVLVQAATQFLFTVAGLALLIVIGGDETLIQVVAISLAIAAPALFGFYLVQRRWGHRLLQAVLTRFAGDRQWRAVGAIDALYGYLRSLYAHPAGLASSSLVHLGAWFLGTLEVYVALAFMGYPVSFADAVVIESLSQAVRGAAFAVPAGLGVQEGGLIALCAVFGIPAEPALALSLVKRAADLAVGAPGFFVWQRLESRRVQGREGAEPPLSRLAEEGGGTIS